MIKKGFQWYIVHTAVYNNKKVPKHCYTGLTLNTIKQFYTDRVMMMYYPKSCIAIALRQRPCESIKTEIKCIHWLCVYLVKCTIC